MKTNHTKDEHGEVRGREDCEKYEHIPELYNVAFWHCAVCKKELVFMDIDKLQHFQDQHEAKKRALVESFTEAMLKDMYKNTPAELRELNDAFAEGVRNYKEKYIKSHHGLSTKEN